MRIENSPTSGTAGPDSSSQEKSRHEISKRVTDTKCEDESSSKINRRRLLKSVGLGTASTALFSDNVVATHQYQIAVYMSDKLANYCYSQWGDTDRAKQRAETYISGAFNRITESEVFIEPSKTIPAPVEYANDSFEARSPCYNNVEMQYDKLFDWWKEYISCKDINTGVDSTILLTSTSSNNGGWASRGGVASHAHTGQGVEQLPSTYNNYGEQGDSAANSMHTVLEEIGHNFQKTNSEHGSVYDPHRTGDNVLRGGTNYATPLGEGFSGYNECNNYVQSCTGWELTWDQDCTVDNFWAPSDY